MPESREKTGDGVVVHIEARRFYKVGQAAVDVDNRLTENQFESSARIELYRPTTPR